MAALSIKDGAFSHQDMILQRVAMSHYALRYQDSQELPAERGFSLDLGTINRERRCSQI